MLLWRGEKGRKYVILDIYLNKNILKRLEVMGVTYGTEIMVLNKKHDGAVIIKVRGIRMALGSTISAGIQIIPKRCESDSI